jgi:outer membrane murein-binding lipoprotein Lpp/uncharacterized small protein (DUF1192 family)
MRVALAICVTLLAGCSSLRPELPKQPDVPTSLSVVSTLTATQDKVDEKVAAAVTVAKENLDKPRVVDSELGVALSLLARPSDSEVALARQRSERATPSDYEAARKFGHSLLSSLDSAQAKLAADQKEAKRVADMKDARIAQLTDDLARLKAEGPRNMVLASAGVCFVAALIMGLIGQYVRSGVAFAIGTFLAALPLLFDSKWFIPSLGGLLLVAVAVELFAVFHPQPPADEQAPKV